MSDTNGQIRAYIEASSRTTAANPGALGALISGRDERHRYCLAPLATYTRRAPLAIDRARTAAGGLLGVDTDTVIHRASMWRRKGSYEAAVASVEAWLTAPVWPVPQIPTELVGYVYGMVAPDFPGMAKIGFSTDPERRVGELQSKHHIRLQLVCAVVGTKLDESLTHFAMADFAMANEWFDLEGRWRAKEPHACIFTPDRMWKQLLGTWEFAK